VIIDLGEVSPDKVAECWRVGTEPLQQRMLWARRILRVLSTEAMVHRNERIRSRTRRPRPVWAHVRANFEATMGYHLSRAPAFRPEPDGVDDASLAAARLGEDLLQAKWVEAGWQAMRQRVLWWVATRGSAGCFVDWDPVEETTVETFVGLNDMCVTPGAVDAETAPWAVKRQVLASAAVRDKYPDLPEGVLGTSFAAGFDWSSPMWRRLSATGDLTEVLTLYARPGAGRPGGVWVVVGDRFAESLPWYYPFGDRLPLAHMKARDDAEAWYGVPGLVDAVPLQEQINEVLSYEVAALRMFGAPKLVAGQRMKDSVEQAMRSLSGVIEVAPGADAAEVPHYLSPPSWHVTAERVLERQAVAADDVQSMSEVQRGIAPPNIESGVGLATLLNSGRGSQLGMIQGQARFYGRLAGMVLQLHSAGVRRPREWLATRGGRRTLSRWSAEQLMGLSRVQVPESSLDPQFQQIMVQVVLAGIGQGLPGYDYTLLADVFEMDSWVQFAERIDPHGQAAVRENERWFAANGEVEMLYARFERTGRPRDRDALRMFLDQAVGSPATYDDHRVHIPQHRSEQVSERFDLLHPVLQGAVEEHVRVHDVYLMQEQEMQAAAMAGVQQGGFAAPGAAPVELAA